MSAADPRELQAVLGGARAPATLTREDRVQLLARAARLLIASGTVEGVFTGHGMLAWLQEGGSLTRDYWRTAGVQGSTATESVLWRRALREERQGVDAVGTIAPSPSKGERRK